MAKALKFNLANNQDDHTANLLVLQNKTDIAETADLLNQFSTRFVSFGSSFFLTCLNLTVTEDIREALAAKSIKYALIFIANPIGGWLSAPNIEDNYAKELADLIQMINYE